MTLLPPTSEQLEEILKELNETNDEKLSTNIEAVKQWLDSQPHMPRNYDERIIPGMIRGCKHQLVRVKSKLDYYYSIRNTVPEFYIDRDVTLPELREIKDVFQIIIFPKLTPNGCRVSLHILKKETANLDFKYVMKLMLMIGDIRMIEENAISGDIFIFDLEEAPKQEMLFKVLNPYVKKALNFTQDAVPQRVKQIHIINSSQMLESAVNFIKKFMKEKIRDRFHVHSSIDSLFKYIPQEIFPSDLGGKEKPSNVLIDELWGKLESYTDYFQSQASVRTDESKRIQWNDGFNKQNGDLEETYGSFHKLNID